MRKQLIVAACLLFSMAFPAFTQGSISLLEKVQGQRVKFHYTYSLSQKGGAFKPVTDGDVTVEENAYRLQGLGLEVLSDGTTRWTLDRDARELVVENVEKENLFTNPALFMASYKQYLDRIRVNSEGADNLDVTLTLDDDTQARFVLSGVTMGPPQGKSDFSLQEKSLSQDYVITDLR